MFGIDWWGLSHHPIVVPVVLALLAGVLAFGRRLWRVLIAIESHVLPHFHAPPPGQPDVSLPGRATAVEQAVQRMREDVNDLDRDLRVHMADEAAQRAADVAEVRTAVVEVHRRIDDIARG